MLGESLAKATALLVPNKGAGDLWSSRGRMFRGPNRRRMVKLIDNDHQGGALLAPACIVVGIDIHAYQRWTKDGEIKLHKNPLVPQEIELNLFENAATST